MDEEDITSKDWIPQYTVDSSSLRSLASQELAKISYRYEIRKNCTRMKRAIPLDWSNGHELRILKKLDVDKNFLLRIIDAERIFTVGHSIDSWIRFHKKRVYFDSSQKIDVLNCLEDLAYNHNGSVSYSNTAKNLLSGDKLNAIEKYRFACLNCLAEAVENLWPLVSNEPRVKYQNDDPLIDYWTRLMKGEFPQLSGTDDDLLDRRLLILELGTWPGIEYLLNNVTQEERVEAIVYLLEYCTQYVTERSSVFLKLTNDKDLFDKVMEKISISRVFFELRFSDELLPEVWNEMRYFISADKFFDLIYFFLFDENCHRAFFSDTSYLFALSMWESAPYHLKLATTIEDIEGIFDEFNANFYEGGPVSEARDVDMRFFLALLADFRLEFRNSLWRKHWTKLIVSGEPEFLDRAMKLCFETEKEIIRFKETEMMNFTNIEYFCSRFIVAGFIPHLEDYLNFCSANVDRVRALKREIIGSPKILSGFVNSRIDQQKFVAFDKFIDGAFISQHDAGNYKNALMVSSKKLQLVYAGVDKKLIGVPWTELVE